jgi:structural maintenance of chromosome 2
MFLSNLTITGFKSYALKTELSEFDPYFNAITGSNGSGKSNIVDAVCFVLGFKNLNDLRYNFN